MRTMAKPHDTDFTTGPLLGRIILFSLPIVLSNMLQLMYNAADTVVVGRFGSTQSLAAVGSTGQMVGLLTNLFIGLSVGVSVMVAQQLGARAHKNVFETVHTAVTVSLVGGAAIAVIGFCSARQLLIWMATPADVLELATIYVKIYFLGMPASMFYNFGSAILRAGGDTKRPLVFLTISGFVNVLFNLLFVIVFRLDTAGVAIATVISQVLSALLVLFALLQTHEPYRFSFRSMRIYGDKLRQMIRLGLPAGIQSSLFSISNVLIQSSLNSFGATTMAGNTAGMNLDNFILMSMDAFSQAAITFTGQNMGAKRYDRIGKITAICVGATIAVGFSLGLLIYLFRFPLLRIFTTDPQVMEMANIRLQIMTPTYFLCGLMGVMCSQIRAMGRSLVPMLVSIVGICAFRIMWNYTFFVWFRSFEMLMISFPISWILTLAMHSACYWTIKRKLIRNQHAENAASANEM